jgi:hypothetical protein
MRAPSASKTARAKAKKFASAKPAKPAKPAPTEPTVSIRRSWAVELVKYLRENNRLHDALTLATELLQA